MNVLSALIRTMRPRQWTKNAFIFAALVFDRQLRKPDAFAITVAGFLLFCLLSSAVYILNDIADLEADRQHPTKRLRPLPAGQLAVRTAWAAFTVILIGALALSYLLQPTFALVAAAYFVLNLVYTFHLKHVPLIDVLSIAAGFVLRVQAGVTLIHVERFSPWLYVVTTLLALFLGFGKRRAELIELADGAANHRRVLDGYTIPLLDQLLTITLATTIVAYSLYTFSAPNLPPNHAMMLTIPFVLYGLFRYLYLVQVEDHGGAPEEALLADRPLQVTILLWALAVLSVFYIF